MAVAEVGSDITDKRRVQGASSQPGTIMGANYKDVAALRARLTAINAAYYTTGRLNDMTENDMVYAVRLNDDAAGI